MYDKQYYSEMTAAKDAEMDKMRERITELEDILNRMEGNLTECHSVIERSSG